MAGDVVTAAVILPEEHGIEGLADSKALSATRRESLFEKIIACAKSWHVARASVEEIDRYNILKATLMAMRRAVAGLDTKPDFIAVDGNKLPAWEYPSEAVIKGDARVAAISAASILAKVTRDREMIALDEQFPGYGFAKNMGYATAQHRAALKTLGSTPLHRKSFAPVKFAYLNPQETLF